MHSWRNRQTRKLEVLVGLPVGVRVSPSALFISPFHSIGLPFSLFQGSLLLINPHG